MASPKPPVLRQQQGAAAPTSAAPTPPTLRKAATSPIGSRETPTPPVRKSEASTSASVSPRQSDARRSEAAATSTPTFSPRQSGVRPEPPASTPTFSLRQSHVRADPPASSTPTLSPRQSNSVSASSSPAMAGRVSRQAGASSSSVTVDGFWARKQRQTESAMERPQVADDHVESHSSNMRPVASPRGSAFSHDMAEVGAARSPPSTSPRVFARSLSVTDQIDAPIAASRRPNPPSRDVSSPSLALKDKPQRGPPPNFAPSGQLE